MNQYQWPSRLPHYAQQTRHVNPMPVQCWSTVTSCSQQPFNTEQCFLLAVVCPLSTSWHEPMSINIGPASPVLASIQSALVSTSCWQKCVHIVYTAPMPFKCRPASYTMARHGTNVGYTNTLPVVGLCSIDSTSRMLWIKAGLMLARCLWRWPTFSKAPNTKR